MSESVEWLVAWIDEDGTPHCAQDGAQTVFGLSSAQKLAKSLGPPWNVAHRYTLLSPGEHKARQREEDRG